MEFFSVYFIKHSGQQFCKCVITIHCMFQYCCQMYDFGLNTEDKAANN